MLYWLSEGLLLRDCLVAQSTNHSKANRGHPALIEMRYLSSRLLVMNHQHHAVLTQLSRKLNLVKPTVETIFELNAKEEFWGSVFADRHSCSKLGPKLIWAYSAARLFLTW